MQKVNYFFDVSRDFFTYSSQHVLTSQILEGEDQTKRIHQVAMDLVKKEGDIEQGAVSSRKRKAFEMKDAPYCQSFESPSKKRMKQDHLELKDHGYPDSFINEEMAQSQFFSFCEPEEWFSLRVNEQGKIQICLPPSLRKIKRIIYIFRNREKKCFLIGKTGGSLNARIPGYITAFNDPRSENRVKMKGKKDFLADIKSHPEHFDVGILHVLEPEEDLDLFETLFIKYKGMHYQLYNDNKGGGGGSSHAEEAPTVYALPKPEIGLLTPVKYYPYKKDEGQVRPQLTPGFKERVKSLREGLEETQMLAYVIKKMDTEERYIGVSIDPLRRSREHGYSSEYFVVESKKYDPSRKTGFLHRAMAKEPEKFAIGLLPLQSVKQIDGEELKHYFLLEGIAQVEQFLIQHKHTLMSQHGFNGNQGGGGPIARQVTKLSAKRELKFE